MEIFNFKHTTNDEADTYRADIHITIKWCHILHITRSVGRILCARYFCRIAYNKMIAILSLH